MQYFVIVFVSFISSVIGAVCGIGGGVIIKPVLDATGIIPVDTISFLSGCTVLSMSLVSVRQNSKKGENSPAIALSDRIAVLLAGGAAVGGIVGKALYQNILGKMQGADRIGAVQGIVLCLLTVGTLIYTLNKSRIRTVRVEGTFPCIVIGLLLGFLSAFLGIGGGPINLVVLYFFFSLKSKEAAAYSLFIIMFSQAASLINSVITGSIPDFSLTVLLLMVGCGILGGAAGVRINKKIKEQTVEQMFIGLMVVIILITIYNVTKYL